MTDSNKGLRILIVEDNPGDQCLITDLLTASVIKIQLLATAGTLGKAIDILQKETFDIILLDLTLPDSAGIETFKAVKKFASKMPVIILSGLTGMNIAVEAISLGAQDYHIKGDLDEKTLTKTILYSVERKRKLENLRDENERYITISKAELDLMQSEEITRQIMKGALDAIICIDVYGKITVWNPQAEKIFGWKQHEILGKTLTETIIPVEFREKHERGIKQYLATGEGMILNKLLEVTAMNREEKHFPAELTIIPLTENGNQFFCAFIRDLSENKRAQEKESKYFKQQKILTELIKAVSRVQKPEEIYELTLDGLQDSIGADKASVLLFDENNVMRFVASGNLSDKYKKAADGHSPWKAGEKDARPIFIPDVSKEPSLQSLLPVINEEGICALGFIPLIHQQQLLGKFMVYFTSVHHFTEEEIQLVQNIASNIAFAIWEKKSAIALKESEEKYRTLVEHASDGIVITGTNGICIDANSTICNMLGYTKEELFSWNLFELLIIKKGDVPLRISEVLAGKSVLQERNVLKKDGNILSVELNSKLLPDNRILVIVRDITERRQIEDALRQSNERNDIVAKATNDAIWDWDLVSGKVYRSKEGLKKVYGYDDNAPIEMVTEWSRQVHPDDREMMEKLIEKIHQSPDQNTFSVEYRFLRQDGSYANVFDRGYILRDEKGKPVRMIGAAQNITERKAAEEKIRASEEQYRDLVDNITDLICTHDLDGRVLSANKAAERLLETKFNPNGNLNIKDILTFDTKNIFNNYIAEIKKKGHAQGLMKIQTSTGKIRIWEYNNSLKTTGVGTPIVRGYARDITERKKAEDLIKKQKEQYDDLVTNIPVGVYKFRMKPDGSMSLDYISPRLCKMIGVKEEDAYSDIMNAFKVVHPDDFSRFMKLIEESYTDKQKFLWEGRTIVNDQVNWVRIESSPKVLKNGDILWDGVIADTTVQKMAEAALKKSEEKYRTLIEQASDPILIYSADGKIKDYNNAFMTSTGYQKKDIENLRLTDFLFEEDLKNNPLRFGKIRKGFSVHDERRARKKDGSAMPVELNSKMMPDGNIMVIARDITDRKKAAEEILKTNARFQMLSKATSDIVWDYNMMDGSVWWNDNYYSLLGIKKEKELTERNDWYSRIHPDDVKRVRENAKKMIQSNDTSWSDEYRFAKADGTYLHFLDRGYVMRNQDGKPYRMVGSMVNMTPVYAAQKKVTESENRLRTIYDTEPECIKVLGPEGELLEMNHAGLDMIEADNLEMVKGKSVLGIIAPPHRKAFDKLTRDVFKGKSGVLEFEIVGLKGTHRWLETHAVPMRDAAGVIIALLGVTRNITERKLAEEAIKLSEEKYRTMIEQAPDGIFISGQDTFIIDANDSGCSMLGYTKEELLKIKYTDLIVPESLQNKPIRYDKLNSGKIVLSERKLIRKDGSVISVEINAKLRSDGRYQSFIRDITSRKKAEQELEESYKAIRKLTEHLQNIREEERAHMAREIHDELGQQLTVMKMDISWVNKRIGVKEEPVKARIKELLLMLDGTVQSVRRIASELRPSLLDDLGLTAAMEWQLTEFEKRFEIKTHFKPDNADIKLPESMKTALFRIFQESLTNVARHSKAKKVTVSLSLHNNSIILSVVDNGVGFDKQNSIGKKTLGILGMQERTLMIGGTYEISGKPGKGTKVVVTIPLIDNNKN